MLHFAEVRINGERRFAFYEDGDGVIVNAGFIRLDEAEHWATWAQYEADYETSVGIYELSMPTPDAHAALGDLAGYRRLCPDWVP